MNKRGGFKCVSMAWRELSGGPCSGDGGGGGAGRPRRALRIGGRACQLLLATSSHANQTLVSILSGAEQHLSGPVLAMSSHGFYTLVSILSGSEQHLPGRPSFLSYQVVSNTDVARHVIPRISNPRFYPIRWRTTSAGPCRADSVLDQLAAQEAHAAERAEEAARSGLLRAERERVDRERQGLTLVHFTAQLERFVCDRGCGGGV
jgi:hypothetical protein